MNHVLLYGRLSANAWMALPHEGAHPAMLTLEVPCDSRVEDGPRSSYVSVLVADFPADLLKRFRKGAKILVEGHVRQTAQRDGINEIWDTRVVARARNVKLAR